MYKTNIRLGNPIYHGTNKYLLSLARDNRKLMTEAERILWSNLRTRQVAGFKFRRQQPIGPFIADFYCHEKKLIIEVDGGYHGDTEQQILDSGRQQELEDMGITVLRFSNEEIESDIQAVINRISTQLKSVR